MKAMTIRISDQAHEQLRELESRDGIAPAIRSRAWILDNLNAELPPVLQKKMELGLDKPRDLNVERRKRSKGKR